MPTSSFIFVTFFLINYVGFASCDQKSTYKVDKMKGCPFFFFKIKIDKGGKSSLLQISWKQGKKLPLCGNENSSTESAEWRHQTLNSHAYPCKGRAGWGVVVVNSRSALSILSIICFEFLVFRLRSFILRWGSFKREDLKKKWKKK